MLLYELIVSAAVWHVDSRPSSAAAYGFDEEGEDGEDGEDGEEEEGEEEIGALAQEAIPLQRSHRPTQGRSRSWRY